MYHYYFYWQFVLAPLWLGRLAWNMECALVRYFSVPVMLRYLFAHWHRDAVPYRLAGIGALAKALAFNTISRIIGAIIRLFVLAAFVLAQLAYLVIAIVSLSLFVLWPLISVILIAAGLGILFGS